MSYETFILFWFVVILVFMLTWSIEQMERNLFMKFIYVSYLFVFFIHSFRPSLILHRAYVINEHGNDVRAPDCSGLYRSSGMWCSVKTHLECPPPGVITLTLFYTFYSISLLCYTTLSKNQLHSSSPLKGPTRGSSGDNLSMNMRRVANKAEKIIIKGRTTSTRGTIKSTTHVFASGGHILLRVRNTIRFTSRSYDKKGNDWGKKRPTFQSTISLKG
eukprot:gene7797-5448_t